MFTIVMYMPTYQYIIVCHETSTLSATLLSSIKYTEFVSCKKHTT